MISTSLELWVCQYVLQHYMGSDRRRMCLELKLSEKMLTRALDKDASAELVLTFEECARYLIARNIDTNAILRQFFLDQE